MKSETFKLADLEKTDIEQLAKQVKSGKIAVIPTDTIYGIVGAANNASTVEKIYKLRKRTSSKPMIILISDVDQISGLGVNVTLKQKALFKKLWPNPISIIIDVPSKKLHYLHRGKDSLAFRMPNHEFLRKFLELTGPIVAPSANFEGEKPAKNINEAQGYFKDSVEFYLDAGTLESPPSTVLKLEKNERSSLSSKSHKKEKLILLREGAGKIPQEFLK